jgi:class 3 adenylate cyclase
MKTDKYTAYCKEHAKEFRDEMRDDASRALRNWPGKTAALLLALSSLLTWLSLQGSGNPHAHQSLLTYAFPIILVFVYPWMSLLFSGIEKYSRQILDLFLLSVLFGFCLSLYLVFLPQVDQSYQSDIFLALSGQINFVILMTTAFSYHISFTITLLRNSVFTLLTALMIYLINADYLAINAIQFIQGYLGGIIVSWLFFSRIQTRFYYKSIDADTRQHLYKQLSKLVYQHQLERIKAGDQLEETMPVEKSQAIINVFDIQRSSNIRHERTQAFFLQVFRAFSQICMMGYKHNPLQARAFRLKETGDGFISAIGYPFLTDSHRTLSDHAVETALMMFQAFDEEVEKFGYGYPIKAAMGLAYNSVQGTFQSSGIRAYDLFGDALVQAYRYEELRKHPDIASQMQDFARSRGLEHYNILIIQEVIYNTLCESFKNLFTAIELKPDAHPVPQDPNARFIYFHVLE